MTPLMFEVIFKGPFLVSTGLARSGADSTYDPELPLPPSALKGLLRAELVERLGVVEGTLSALFGTGGQAMSGAAGWVWEEAEFNTPITVGSASRIRRSTAGSVQRGFLAILDVAWADRARFVVRPVRRFDDERYRAHTLLLRAAARSVSSLGSHRLRGYGRVTIRDIDRVTGAEVPWTTEDTDHFLRLRKLM